MLFDLFGWLLLESDVAAVFNSPFVIPVAGCIMVACIVTSGAWARVRSQEIKSQERLARIAQGLPVEPDWDQATVRATTTAAGGEEPPGFQGYQTLKEYGRKMKEYDRRSNDGARARRAGIVLVSVGAGLFAFFAALSAIVQVREVLSGGAAGLIPFAIGIGFLVDARLKKQEYERYLEWERFGAGAEAGMNAVSGSVPPPPPAGMSPAQASDWRPLH